MKSEEINWRCDGRDIRVGLDRAGTGPTVLLLPALSSISTRHEMRPLQERLARSFTAITVDWPGFGDRPKPFVDWRPEIYEAFLDHLFRQIVPEPFGTIAAGHAAGYAIKHFASAGRAAGRLVLLSATWRGPLPTLMGGNRTLFPRMARAFDPPVLGAMLYSLNVNRLVIGMMARGHVYANREWLRGHRMREKLAVTRVPGARHASARFVSGCLDPFRSREEQARVLQHVVVPVLNVFSEQAPEKSRAEMEALATSPNVGTVRLPRGKLSVYEEFPDITAGVIGEFLAAAVARG
ncbi:MAG: alpha/beta fold hydrolase [Acidiferrobacterales bacterium]